MVIEIWCASAPVTACSYPIVSALPDPSNLTAGQYSHLREQLSFVQEHDKHTDIASGTTHCDKSLVAKILAAVDLKDSATAAQEEALNSEPQVHSVLQRHLSAVLHDIWKQIKNHEHPDCYCYNSFIIHAKHPVWALHDTAIDGLKPDCLYHWDVFVWLLALLPGALDWFKCVCGRCLNENGAFYV
jgi:hypothetical protein